MEVAWVWKEIGSRGHRPVQPCFSGKSSRSSSVSRRLQQRFYWLAQQQKLPVSSLKQAAAVHANDTTRSSTEGGGWRWIHNCAGGCWGPQWQRLPVSFTERALETTVAAPDSPRSSLLLAPPVLSAMLLVTAILSGYSPLFAPLCCYRFLTELLSPARPIFVLGYLISLLWEGRSCSCFLPLSKFSRKLHSLVFQKFTHHTELSLREPPLV